VSAPLQDLPLPALWQRARAVLKHLEVVPASDPRAQQLVQQGTACLRAAACAVDALALFSANEDKDDLATGDVKYLMIPVYQAEVLGHTHAGVGR
jgi:immunoglobulin-binding protein 1